MVSLPPAGMPLPTRVRTVPAHDELHQDGESLVLLDGRLRRVSPVGTAIRGYAMDGADLDELARVLDELFGTPEHGDLAGLTRAAVAALLAEGLLEPVPADD